MRNTLLILFILFLTPCFARRHSPKAAAQSDSSFSQRLHQSKASDFTISAQQLRSILNQLSINYTALIEKSADSIITESTSSIIRHNATQWKLSATPTIYRSLFYNRPLIGFIDTWAYAIQMRNYFADSSSSSSFENYQKIGYNASLKLQQEIERLAVTLPINHDISKAKAMVESWAQDHPIASFSDHRESMILFLTEGNGSNNLSTFAALGRLTNQLDDIMIQLTTYGAYIPKGIQWQSELILTEVAESPFIDTLRLEIDSITDAVFSIEQTLSNIPSLVDYQRDTIFSLVQQTINSQRDTLLQFASFTIDSLIAVIQQERATIFLSTDSLIQKTSNQAILQTKEVIDHLFVKLFQLIFLIFVLGLILFVVQKRLSTTKE